MSQSGGISAWEIPGPTGAGESFAPAFNNLRSPFARGSTGEFKRPSLIYGGGMGVSGGGCGVTEPPSGEMGTCGKMLSKTWNRLIGQCVNCLHLATSGGEELQRNASKVMMVSKAHFKAHFKYFQ